MTDHGVWTILLARPVLGIVAVPASAAAAGIKYKVDDAALDNVSAGEKQGVFDAKNEIEIAHSELRNAQSKLDALDRDRDVAKNEKKQADLEVEKAATEEESAVASRDENRHNAAKHGKDVAAFGVKVSDAKLEWLDQKEDALKAERTAAEAHQKAPPRPRPELEKAEAGPAEGHQAGLRVLGGRLREPVEGQEQRLGVGRRRTPNPNRRRRTSASRSGKTWLRNTRSCAGDATLARESWRATSRGSNGGDPWILWRIASGLD